MNKQIEEMANIERLLRVRKLDIEKQGFDVATIFYGRESEEASIARYLVGEGYRKASDVAREIFEEIDAELGNELEKADDETIVFSYDGIVDRVLDKLKKKYESEREE
jgi:hypothetical protein